MKRKSLAVAPVQANFGERCVLVRGDAKNFIFGSGSLRIFLFKLTFKRQTDVPVEDFPDFINR